MSARFLVRFDDICPTMNWSIWTRVESMLERHGVKPLLAVVPDNRDARLVINPPHPEFWDRVRLWQARGWTIGLHGYQHSYVTRNAGLIGLNPYSEFAGLTYAEQREKIEKALTIFARENVRPEAWIAPAHAFDDTTVRILIETGLKTISDGFYFRPVQKLGAIWIPQQLWKFRRLPAGIWTVCFHANEFSEKSLAKLEHDLTRFHRCLVSWPEAIVRHRARQVTFVDRTFSKFWLWKLTRHNRK